MHTAVPIFARAAFFKFNLYSIKYGRIDDCLMGVVLQGEYFAPPGADNMSLAMPSVTPLPPKSGSEASAGGSSSGSLRRWKACPMR
jgi:hypothetical protein